MKAKYLIPALFLGVFSSCNSILEDVDFNVTPAVENVYKVGEPVTFNFNGNPDYITFFSGEEGHNYKNRFRTEIAMEDIASAEFSFGVKRQYGVQSNTLQVFMSDSFTGLAKNDMQADADAISSHAWVEAAPVAELEKCSDKAFTLINPIDISDYLNHFVVAFKFTGKEGGVQRTWTLNQFKIRCTLKSGLVIESGSATALNFAAFDMLRVGSDVNPYEFTITGKPLKGTWFGGSIGSQNQVQMQGGTATQPDNEDWLISTPLKLNSCDPDKGLALKDMTESLNSYSYVFEKAGTYEVAFVAGNSNYQGEDEIVKKVTITIQE